MTKTQQYRKENGICMWCGRKPSRPGRTLCLDCALKNSQYNAERYAKKKAAGMHSGPRGRAPVRFFIVRDPLTNEEIFYGTASQIANEFHSTSHAVYRAADMGLSFKRRYTIQQDLGRNT